ncbi:MAG TPA: WhiB family transcriptional regulator [Propionibacteriaceae bacterium]|nr:WhiB family transcriptional regulator [Propionibacteriaceae bacterium]
MSISHRSDQTLPGCVQFGALFQDPRLEEPPAASAPADQRRRYAALEREANGVCRSCPVLERCLYVAVVQHDVAGFVAATTAKQRIEMRRRLGIRVEAEDFDSLTGATRQHRQVDHDEVVRLHRANPDQTYEQLAERLECSLSTVKRHLRQDRRSGAAPKSRQRVRPTEAEVTAAFDQIVGRAGLDHRSAA